MSNYNSTLQSNNTDLQAILNTINGLPNAGGSDPVLQDKTVTPSTSQQYIQADVGYDGLDTVTVNAMPTTTQATPSITINASGLITATATQTAGYVSAGTKSATKQLAFQAAKTITPTTVNQTAVSSGYYTGGAITVQGDSNLVAGNIKSGTSIFGVTGTYSGSGGGDASTADAIIEKTLTSYESNEIDTIGSYAFNMCQSLKTVNFPNVKSIGIYAFEKCYSLQSINCPSCTSIGYGAFSNCSKLSKVNFPMAISIGSYMFAFCSALSSATFPSANRVESYAFSNCTALSYVNFSVAKSINASAFDGCNKLATAIFPQVVSIGSNAFYFCYNLTSISFPVATTIYSSAFYGCSKLATASFPKLSKIYSYAFNRCSTLSTIYLTNPSVCQLSNSNAFSSTGIWSNKGSIFVPSSLVASYKTATNWTFFSNRIYSA